MTFETSMRVKLPKQWARWCYRAGLKPDRSRRSIYRYPTHPRAYMCLKGRGFVWRVNCYAELERGDPNREFDRWAMCNIARARLPKTEKEFLQTVEHLISCYNQD